MYDPLPFAIIFTALMEVRKMAILTLMGTFFIVGVCTMVLKWAGSAATKAKNDIWSKMKNK